MLPSSRAPLAEGTDHGYVPEHFISGKIVDDAFDKRFLWSDNYHPDMLIDTVFPDGIEIQWRKVQIGSTLGCTGIAGRDEQC